MLKWESVRTVLALIGLITVIYLFGNTISELADWLLNFTRSIVN